MGSISGLSGSSLNSTSALRGYGGLASGLDRDTLIENMTYATRSKISAQRQKKQSISWTQSAMREITEKLYQFSEKYTSYSSSTNLLGSKMFSRNMITAQGINSKYVSVSGSSTTAETFSILGVKNLAEDAKMTSNGAVSDQILQTGGINKDLAATTDIDVVAGDSMYIKYGTQLYSVTLPQGEGYDYSTPEQAVESINKALGEVSIGDKKTLASVMQFETAPGTEDGKSKITVKSTDTAGNTISFAGATGGLLKDLGFMGDDEEFSELPEDRTTITAEGLTGQKDAQVAEKVSLADQLKGKQISFSYNGTVKWITLGDYTADNTLEDVQADIQKKLNEEFGNGRIKVSLEDIGGTNPDHARLAFKTTTPAEADDPSSVLSITAADKGILGSKGVFGIQSGESNRVNLSASLAESGLKLKGAVGTDTMIIKNGVGEEINLMDEKYGLTWDSSVNDIIKTVNGIKELGINISYQANSDKFVVQSTEQGASGKIALSGNLAEAMFGMAGTDYTVDEGKDAVIRIKYAGSGGEMEITRGSNSMTIDGLNLNLKGTFGYNDSGYIADTEAITFNAEVDTDTTSKAVKEMVEAFNEALELINTQVSQKPNRDYAPLTDEQREGLSDSQVEKWEVEAKKGLLFNDTDVRGLADSLRFILPADKRADFERMGISVSTSYQDNGKLVFNEDKFKAALASDPESVQKAFTSLGETQSDGTVKEGGLMVKMKTVMDRYASMTGATKGVLVERAGSTHAPTTILRNSMQKQMDEIDDAVSQLQDKLKIEQDRYISQFTSLETLISQMNSQSSYLSSMFAQ